MRSTTPKPSLLAAFWFGLSVVWGALLGVSLQARSAELTGSHALAAYGALASTGAAIAAVTQIAIGIWADRRRANGSRRIEFYAAGVLFAAAGLFWFYNASNFPQLFAALICVQLAMNIAIGPYQAVIPDFLTDAQVGTASSWMSALQSLGNAFGAIVAARVGSANAIAAIIAASLLAACGITSAHVRKLQLQPAPVERLHLTRAFVDLFVSRAFVFLGFYTLVGYAFFYVRATLPGDTKTITGVIILLVTASGAAGALIAARPADRYDRRVVAAAGAACFVGAICAFLFSHTLLTIAGSAVIAGVSWGIFLSGDWALGCKYVPRFALATGMGIWNLAVLIPQIAAPLVATGLLAALSALQSPSAPRIAFVAAAIEVVVGIAWIWRLPATLASVESKAAGNIP